MANPGRTITNTLTGAAAATTGFRVSLYWMPDSATAPTTAEFPANHVATTVNLIAPGVFSATAGATIPGTNSGGIPAGGFAWVQVRAWEILFGTSYEAAINAPAQDVGGQNRKALVGTSNIFRVDSGDPTVSPPGTPANLVNSGLGYIRLTVVPEPSVIALGALGIGALFLLRRRK